MYLPDDTSTVQTLLSLLFKLTVQQKSCAPVILAIGRDVHSQLGDIDQVSLFTNVCVFYMQTIQSSISGNSTIYYTFYFGNPVHIH